MVGAACRLSAGAVRASGGVGRGGSGDVPVMFRFLSKGLAFFWRKADAEETEAAKGGSPQQARVLAEGSGLTEENDSALSKRASEGAFRCSSLSRSLLCNPILRHVPWEGSGASFPQVVLDLHISALH